MFVYNNLNEKNKFVKRILDDILTQIVPELNIEIYKKAFCYGLHSLDMYASEGHATIYYNGRRVGRIFTDFIIYQNKSSQDGGPTPILILKFIKGHILPEDHSIIQTFKQKFDKYDCEHLFVIY